SMIAQRRAKNFSECSKTPITYGFPMRSMFARLQRVRRARDARAITKPDRNDALSIPSNLCKKFSAQRPAKALPTAEFGRNRANRPAKAYAENQPKGTAHRGQTTEILASSSLYPSSVVGCASLVIRCRAWF